MIRRRLMQKGVGGKKRFRWRGTEMARLEGFSDAVLAFAVTLLIVSLEVPETFGELIAMMRGFFAFALCFALLMFVWYEQYTYFRRYALQDAVSVVLNAALLFVVLFYVYPLKFLFSLLVDAWMGRELIAHTERGIEAVIQAAEIPTLMIIFSAGFVAVFIIFTLLYLHAYRKREELELNELERFDTVESIFGSLINVTVGTVSIAIAFFGGARYSNLAGMIYPLLLAPSLTVFYTIAGSRRRKIEKKYE